MDKIKFNKKDQEFLTRVKKEMFELYFDDKISNEDFYGAEKFLKILEKKYKSLNESNKKLSRQIMKTAVKTLPEDKPKTRKIVINSKYGGFGLSEEARKRYEELSGHKYPGDYNIQRDDPILIRVVEELKEKVNGDCARLKIVEIPYDVDWQIEEYDGNEWVAEKHRTWD